MIKKLLLSGLTLIPSLVSIPNQITNTSTFVQDVQEQPESCTFMYVGKNASTTGLAYIARCGDAGPRGMNMHAQIFNHNQLANQVIKGKNGFEYTMPSTTYKYMGTPRNPLVRNGIHWEVSTINEMGVACSATLTCNTNAAARTAEPFEATGISEDNIAQIVGATASSAREGVKIIADIIDKQGKNGSDAIMISDKNEAWFMEMYTGHQYVAVKMPDDKCCTIGNEFLLNTLKDFDPSNVITSKNYYSLPRDKGFAKYDGTPSEANLHLYNTYAGEGTEQGNFVDSCHMRTWRGISLFADSQDKYDPNKKYDPFFTPAKKLSVSDIITYYRDRYDDILTDESNPNHDYFLNSYIQGELRWVGDKSTYQIHIISVDPTLPTEISATEWMALSSSNYTPFVPYNNGINSLNSYYTYVTPDYGYDEKAACCLFKRLNVLADEDRINYGLPIESFITHYESIWQKQYSDILTQIKTLSLAEQENVLTNYSCQIQDNAITMSKNLYEDLMWHIANMSIYAKNKLFTPLVDLQYYAYCYDWDYSFKDNIATLKNNNDTLSIDFNYTARPTTGWVMGKLYKNDQLLEKEIRVKTKNNRTYIDYEKAKTYMSNDHEIATINYKDYYILPSSEPTWVIPVVIAAPLAACLLGIVIFSAIWQNKKKKAQGQQQT